MTYRSRGVDVRTSKFAKFVLAGAVLAAAALAVGCKADGPGPNSGDDDETVQDTGSEMVDVAPDTAEPEDTGVDATEDVAPVYGELSVEPGQLQFEGVANGESASKTVSLRNVGDGEVVIESVTLEEDEPGTADEELSIEGMPEEPPFAIEPGTFDSIEILYEPTDYRVDRGTLTVETRSDEVEGAEVSIATVLAEPDLRAPDLVRFGTVPQGETATREISIYNRGIQPLEIEDVAYFDQDGESDPDFSVGYRGSGPRLSLERGESLTVLLDYEASDTQLRRGRLEVTSNDPEGTYNVDITANRAEPCIAVTDESLDFDELGAGSETKDIGILNCNTERDLTVESAEFVTDGGGAFSLVDAPEFPVTVEPATFGSDAEQTLTVQADLDEERQAVGNLEIRSDDPNNSPILVEIRANVGQ
jgi:hypothetical protein